MSVHNFASHLAAAAVLFVILGVVIGDTLPTCQPNDFHYEYTECDSEGGRWRVSVPKPNTCTGGAPNPPIRGKSCSYTCDPGHYLDLVDQECKRCHAGTYSMGGGVRFDDWDTIPTGFSVSTESFGSSFMTDDSDTDEVNCTSSRWTAAGAFISSLPGECSSSLTYSALLVKDGSLSFEYQYTDEQAIFHFVVKNDQCESYSSHDTNQWPSVTADGDFKRIHVNLKKGLNVLTWKTIGVYTSNDGKPSDKPVRIRKISLSGVAYTSQCTSCKAGTYSSDGAEVCTLCPENTVSQKGDSQCKPCDAKTEYSRGGASACLKRPACTKRDYFEIEGPCDENGKTRKEYKWVSPQVCRTDLPGSAQLPTNGELKTCPPCNPGMESVNVSGNCSYCKNGEYSDGTKCQACPASTSPNYGLSFHYWNKLPSIITSDCINFHSTDCLEDSKWFVAGDHIKTHYGQLQDSYLILSLKVNGFRPRESENKDTEAGTISFVFETNCSGECQLLFLSDEGSSHSSIVKEFTGTQSKQHFKHVIKTSGPIVFTWAFQHSSTYKVEESVAKKYIDDMAKIYSIDVTNTLEGGAVSCQKCPKGVQKNGCVPCPKGFYVEDNGQASCKKCPDNTVVKNGLSYGIESCKTCGAGLHPKDESSCVTDCSFTSVNGQMFDFSSLVGFQYLEGSKLFTASGTQYFHGFNMTLCGGKPGKALCYNNASSSDDKTKSSASVSAMVCRATMIPSRSSGSIVSTQPVSLGDYLEKIVHNTTDLVDKYKEEGFETEGIENDVHFYYKSDSTTGACPKGRTTIVSLRCDLKMNEMGRIVLPPKCADGTCDGCLFHFMWLTENACPKCIKSDYKRIVGECVKGEQIIHYTPPSHCLLKGEKPEEEKRKCTLKFDSFPMAMKIAVPVVLGVALLLLGLILYCWYKNRSLEYKYMKLVENNGPNYDGELPGVDSCALEDGEEEHFDSVGFKESRAPKFFQKLRSKKREDDNPFETSHTEKIPLT